MTSKKEITDLIYRFVLTLALAIFLFLEIYNFYDPELITKKNLLFLTFISLSFNVLILLYRKLHFYIFPAIIIVLAIFYFSLDKEDIEKILESLFFKLVMIGLISFVVFLISDISNKIHLILASGMLIYLFVTLFRETEIHPATPAITVFYAVFSVSVLIRSKFRTADPQRNRTYVTCLYPFLLAIPIILILLPKPENPISWNWVKELYDYTVDKLNQLGHELSIHLFNSDSSETFNIDFEMDEDLNTKNSDSETNVMSIVGDNRVTGGVYLKGSYFNEFRNGGWKNTLATDKDYSTIDTLETVYGVYNFDSFSLSSFLRTETIDIRYLNLTTSIMFLPAKPEGNLSGEIHYKNEHTLFDDVQTYGTQYSLKYIQPNYGSPAFIDFMNASLSENNEALQIAKNTYLKGMYSDIELDDIYEYRDYIHKYYSSSPDIRDSVKDWINKVTEGAKTDYEKLLKVEYALSSMTYTLNEGSLPDYVQTEGDFLDYFLIEKQKGYCVHFATAFCLIARYLGFDARVVHGYKADVEPNKTVFVTNRSGHLWPEVYFKGKGWIAFEPTPGFRIARYHGWTIFGGKYSQYDYDQYPFSPSSDINEETELIIDEEYLPETEDNNISGLLILIIAAIILLSVILLILVNTILSHIKRKRMTEKELYFLEFKKTLNVLKEFKLRLNPGETIEEFSLRCKKSLSEKAEAYEFPEPRKNYTDISFFNLYEKSLYSNYSPDSSDTEQLKNVSVKLMTVMKKFYGRTYLIHKLHLMISQAMV